MTAGLKFRLKKLMGTEDETRTVAGTRAVDTAASGEAQDRRAVETMMVRRQAGMHETHRRTPEVILREVAAEGGQVPPRGRAMQ